MNELHLKVTGIYNGRTGVFIDGEEICPKLNKYASAGYVYNTDKDEVEVCIVKYHELEGKWWWLLSILFHIISLCGILNPRYDGKAIMFDCRFSVTLMPVSEVTVAFRPPVKNADGFGQAYELRTACETRPKSNEYYVDARLKHRCKTMLVIKVVVTFLIAVTVAVILAVA